MKFTYWKNQYNQWYWRLRAHNGQIIASGEGYVNQVDCLRAINLVKLAHDAPVAEETILDVLRPSILPK